MSEIAERIQFNARRSAEYCDGVVLSDANIDQIIQAETGYEKEIDALRSRIAELEKALRIADDEYAYATSQYYNEPVPPPSSYDRWLSLAQNPAPPEEAK